MSTLTWQKIEEGEIREKLFSPNALLAKKRTAAFDRLMTDDAGRDFKKTVITVAEGKTLEMNLKGEAGVSVIEFRLAPHSHLKLSHIQTDAEISGMTLVRIFAERGATINAFSAVLGGANVSLFQETHLQGEESSIEERTIFLGSKKEVFTMASTTFLEKPSTRAYVEAKGVLLDSAEARFDGGITIEQTAHNADAKLIEHTLLLSEHAKMNAIPALTIGTNDVKATHSASMTRVDDEQLFFALSRGISEEKAVELIAKGFLAAVYKDHPEKKELSRLIKKKLCAA